MGRGEAQEGAVDQEQKLHMDMVLLPFKDDDYFGLLNKTLAIFTHAVESFPKTSFVMKADDDIFVNMGALFLAIEFLDPSTLYFGRMHLNATPIRDEHRWKLTHEEFAGDTFPTYTAGSSYVLELDEH